MSSKIYLETSVIGYLTSRPSKDLITAANQRLTHDWWDQHLEGYDLYISEAVVAECRVGDAEAARERLNALEGIRVLAISDEAERLAEELIEGIPLPHNAEVDALHIGIATVNGLDFLVTWNCTHIANAALQHQIQAICRTAGFESPTICTPQQLMGD